MWLPDNDQYVRAPTPKAFDRLVQNLEDNDSVLFESIALPKSSNEPPKPVVPEPDPEPEPSFGQDSFEDTDIVDEANDIEDLKKRIVEVSERNSSYRFRTD